MYPTLWRIPLPWGGSLPIHAYGVMVALGMLAAIWVTAHRARRAGVDPEIFYDLGFWAMLSGIAGARANYVMIHWADQFQERPWAAFKIWEGGQVLYGGLLLAGLVCLGIIYRRNLPLLKTADLAAPAVPLGIAIGRLGCFLNGCCWGRPSGPDNPFAVLFPGTAAVYHSSEGLGLREAPWAVHPTQLYATALGILLYIFLSVWHDRKRWDGQILSGLMMGYAGIRLLEEHFRSDTPRQLSFWGLLELNAGETVSVCMLAAGFLGYLLWGVRGRSRLQQL